MKINKFLTILITTIAISCGGDGDGPDPVGPIIGGPTTGGGTTGGTTGETESLVYTPTKTLKGTADFPIGTVVSANKLSSSSYSTFRTILNGEFNSITAENDMKMASMFTGPDTYNFNNGDAIVTYAKDNGMRVFGHTLIWHSSIPSWLNSYSGTDEEFEAQIEGYIKATVSHFAEFKNSNGEPVVAGWDVVNEAFTDDANNAVFKKRMGADYVAKCFKWAREANADVKLFYNDYNLESQTSKVTEVVNMVNRFKSEGVPIDGIGLQMHIDYKDPDVNTISNNLNTLVDTDLLIHFSEMDMTVNRDKVLSELTYERAVEQQNRFEEVVALYNTIPNNQKFGITLWGMRDSDSWLLNFHNNQNEWPLLFNADYEYKIAHKGFIEGL